VVFAECVGDLATTEKQNAARRATAVCDQIVHIIVLSDTQTIASPVVMEVRAEVERFVQIMIRRNK
jgi:hypothetical protein